MSFSLHSNPSQHCCPSVCALAGSQNQEQSRDLSQTPLILCPNQQPNHCAKCWLLREDFEVHLCICPILPVCTLVTSQVQQGVKQGDGSDEAMKAPASYTGVPGLQFMTSASHRCKPWEAAVLAQGIRLLPLLHETQLVVLAPTYSTSPSQSLQESGE